MSRNDSKKDDFCMSASALQSTCVQDFREDPVEEVISSREHSLCMWLYVSLSMDRAIKKLEFTSIILTGGLHAQMLQVLTHHITSLLFGVIGPSSVWLYDWALKDISKFFNMSSLPLKKEAFCLGA